MNREQLIEYISDEYCVKGERLWAKFPNYMVFRNRRNKKWFALVADIEKSKLGLKGEGRIDAVNLKCDPILAGSLINNKNYFRAYHMNKEQWITVIIGEQTPDGEIKDLIRLSYDMIDNKK